MHPFLKTVQYNTHIFERGGRTMYELAILLEFICFLYIRFLRGGKIHIWYYFSRFAAER